MKFKVKSEYKPKGDQPEAIEKLVNGLEKNYRDQTLLGVTGSGKTFTIANVIEKVAKPTLIISHNKTLAAQLYQEFREFFPDNSVNYFVSYYDYYQPEAYLPTTDTYIEKETDVNEEIDKLRLAATTALATRKDVIVIASVSAIYNLGPPSEYQNARVYLEEGQKWNRKDLLTSLARLQYARNDTDFLRGTYRVRGENIEIYPSYENEGIRLNFVDTKLRKIEKFHPVSSQRIEKIESNAIYPAKHYIAGEDSIDYAIKSIEDELALRIKYFKDKNKLLEEHRIRERTLYDLEMIRTIGYCKGIENYSRHFDGRGPGDPPFSLLEHFPKDFLLVIDESHMTVPQIHGMYNGDRARKQVLVDFGFRLPSAFDNRPLKFDEFDARINQVIYTSATPAEYELKISTQVVEQLVRPTGLVDPEITIKKSKGQIPDLIKEIENRVSKKERVLVTTLTKRMAEELAKYLEERKIKVNYLHSEVHTLDRSDILDDLRLGNYDVLVGINLLREGLDLPEVSLVAILDADKEGFLRSETSLIQIMGRTSRNIRGEVILYADTITGSIKRAMKEVERRREIQLVYNKKNKITPKSIEKPIREKLIKRDKEDKEKRNIFKDKVIEQTIARALEGNLVPEDKSKLVRVLTREMKETAKILDFEKAAMLRDQIQKIKSN